MCGEEEAGALRSEGWQEAVGVWTSNQRQYGKAFKKPTSERSKSEKTYAGKTTERRVALLGGTGCLDWAI